MPLPGIGYPQVVPVERVDQRLIDGRYGRVEELGRGGFGVVWRAHDTLLERDVAIKEVRFPEVLDEEEQAGVREKVLREARAAARLSHPALITVYDVVEEDGRPFIVMELVDAPTLAQRVASEGPLPEQEAARIGEQVLDALATAHAHGIVHRDVKPANVMVSPTGRVQLGDFGIASILDDPKVTSSGQLAGSPSYMAPEQAQNRPAGPATDLWGLAATLYFAVEGEPPFEKDGAIPTLTSVVNDDPRPVQRAAALAPLLRELLVKEPSTRLTVEEVRRRLAEVAAGSPVVPARPAPAPEPTMELDADPLPPLAVTRAEPVAPPAPPEPDEVPAPVVPHVRRRPARQSPTGPALLVALAALLAIVLVAVLASRDRSPTSSPQDPDSAQTSRPSESGSEDTESAETGDSSEEEGEVPRGWASYEDPATGFAIAYPRGWTVERNGTLTDFRDPRSGAYLRVDHTSSPGPSPEQAWRELETRFAAENPEYRRLRIASTTFKGFPAAIWEFTYTGRGVPLRAVDLGFVTGEYGFALNFQSRAEDWEDMQDVFESFKDSFEAPAG